VISGQSSVTGHSAAAPFFASHWPLTTDHSLLLASARIQR